MASRTFRAASSDRREKPQGGVFSKQLRMRLRGVVKIAILRNGQRGVAQRDTIFEHFENDYRETNSHRCRIEPTDHRFGREFWFPPNR